MSYSVVGLDADGCELTSREAFSMKEVREELRLIESDTEYFDSGLVRVQVQNGDGVMVIDRPVVNRKHVRALLRAKK